jgi:hypothetical protein
MTPSNEERVIQQKLKELSGLVEQRDQIQARIGKTEAAIRAFIELLEDERDQQLYSARLTSASKPLGLTEAIKRIFVQAKEPLLPMAVRDRLVESSFPLSGYSNPMAVIYTTITRLRDQDLIEECGKESGAFRWIAKESLMRDFGQKRGEGERASTMPPPTRQRGRSFTDDMVGMMAPYIRKKK